MITATDMAEYGWATDSIECRECGLEAVRRGMAEMDRTGTKERVTWIGWNQCRDCGWKGNRQETRIV